MRKVDLGMKEQNVYEIVKTLVDKGGNKKTAAIRLGKTQRTINRLIKIYKDKGKIGFIHGNTGRAPAKAYTDEFHDRVSYLYSSKYWDAGIEHAAELIEKYDSLKVSTTTLRSILLKVHILSPYARKKTVKAERIRLETQKSKAGLSVKEKEKIAQYILNLDESHPRRPRKANAGELIQMDASIHPWFGSEKSTLHLAIDDATGTLTGGYFEKEETLSGYYNVFAQMLRDYGIPYQFLTDRRTVFEYNKINNPSPSDDTFTQFSYACKQLGVIISTSSIPQVKGRIERAFGTLQKRLVVELRLADVSTLEQANIFLKSYIKDFNRQFALDIHNSKSVFEKQLDEEIINLTLAVLDERKIDSGHCVKYFNNYYRPIDALGMPVYFYKKTKAIVIKALNQDLFVSIHDVIYSLEVIPMNEATSKAFNPSKEKSVQKTVYVPPMSHPWKAASYEKFFKRISA